MEFYAGNAPGVYAERVAAQGTGASSYGVEFVSSQAPILLYSTLSAAAYGARAYFSPDALIIGNAVESTTLGGVALEYSNSSVVTGNEFYNAGTSFHDLHQTDGASVLLSNSDDIVVYDNTMTGVPVYGILVLASQNAELYENRIAYCQGLGCIRVWSGSTARACTTTR